MEFEWKSIFSSGKWQHACYLPEILLNRVLVQSLLRLMSDGLGAAAFWFTFWILGIFKQMISKVSKDFNWRDFRMEISLGVLSYARKGRFVLLERPFYAGTSAFWLFVLLEDTDEEVRNAAWESTSLLWELEFCFLTYVEELLAYSKLVCLKIVFGPGFRHSVSFYLDADSFKSTSFLVSGCSWCGKNSRMLNSLGSFCRELNLEINRWF